MTAFDHNNLLNKSKLFTQRAFDEDRDSDLFPFWLALSLELLARSTLAKVSPTLLADTSSIDESTTNLLYSLGFEVTNKPRSIQTNQVFNRLQRIIPEFKQEEAKICMAILEQRNAELHSGVKGFEDYPSDIWLPDFFKICKIFLKSQGLELVDYLGKEEGKAAEIMIEEGVANIKKTVKDKIQAFKSVFANYTDDEKNEKRKNAEQENKKNRRFSKLVQCPSCEYRAVLQGEFVSISNPKLDSGRYIEQEIRLLPTTLNCYCCNFRLTGHSELKAIDLGSQFTIKTELDPVDFHDIDVRDYIDIDEEVREKLREQGYLIDGYQDE